MFQFLGYIELLHYSHFKVGIIITANQKQNNCHD